MTTWADYYWLAWLGIVWLMFLPVELWAALSGHSQDTLSDTMWSWTSQDPTHPWNFAHYSWPHWLLIAFMVWLTLHLCWGLLSP